jgi:hypothetical protein
LTQVTQTGLEVKISDDTQTFPRLSLYDLAAVEEGRKAKAKDAADKDGKASGLTPYDVYNVKLDIEARELTVGDWLRYAQTPSGASTILIKSLSKVGVKPADAKTLIQKLDPHEAVGLAHKVLMHNEARLEFEEEQKLKEEKLKNDQEANGTQTADSPASDDAASTSTEAGSTSTSVIDDTKSEDDGVEKCFGE